MGMENLGDLVAEIRKPISTASSTTATSVTSSASTRSKDQSTNSESSRC
jgi:hypothetical protein